VLRTGGWEVLYSRVEVVVAVKSRNKHAIHCSKTYFINFIGGGVKIKGYVIIFEATIPDSSFFDSTISV
jgi:hypothetical protein